MNRAKLVVANWKMNGSLAFVEDFIRDIIKYDFSPNVGIVILPPLLYVDRVKQLLEYSDIKVGVQNVSQFSGGAYTGEISMAMLKDYSCEYVLVGHSERRTYFSESDADVVEKFFQVIHSGQIPIFCVGEALKDRENNIAEAVVRKQCNVLFTDPRFSMCKPENFVIAYEPIWAIGTGKVASAQDANEMHQVIRDNLAECDKSIAENVTIIYGGSVNAGNAKSLFEQDNIDGALVGGASLEVSSFGEVCNLCSSCCL